MSLPFVAVPMSVPDCSVDVLASINARIAGSATDGDATRDEIFGGRKKYLKTGAPLPFEGHTVMEVVSVEQLDALAHVDELLVRPLGALGLLERFGFVAPEHYHITTMDLINQKHRAGLAGYDAVAARVAAAAQGFVRDLAGRVTLSGYVEGVRTWGGRYIVLAVELDAHSQELCVQVRRARATVATHAGTLPRTASRPPLSPS